MCVHACMHAHLLSFFHGARYRHTGLLWPQTFSGAGADETGGLLGGGGTASPHTVLMEVAVVATVTRAMPWWGEDLFKGTAALITSPATSK